MKADFKVVDRIIESYGCKKNSLIQILQDVQEKYNYLPRKFVERVARKLGVSLSKAYAVATFYKAFSLNPRGENLIRVCMGTACHIKGAPEVVEEFSKILKIKPGETTEDLKYSLETVNCVGACAMAPVVVVNNEYYGNMTPGKVRDILKKKETRKG
ncbi:MAG: hypothetical protein PWQ82_1742 [Thermosediminibacterales bacterium]|nr:hypothetical protein [Thermosediminibacterales bacterium]MDK2836804.1 hypothetical protein [Thermosediminibacterales bacterium]